MHTVQSFYVISLEDISGGSDIEYDAARACPTAYPYVALLHSSDCAPACCGGYYFLRDLHVWAHHHKCMHEVHSCNTIGLVKFGLRCTLTGSGPEISRACL